MSLHWKENPDLVTSTDHKAGWNTPDNRRRGFHNLDRITRYGVSLRSDKVLRLEKRVDRHIGEMNEVLQLTGASAFSAMIVLKDQYILHESYAPDFDQSGIHSIMSITKTTINLMIGRLVRDSEIDLSRRVGYYLPDVGSGYADATVQQVLNMDVCNNFLEDYSDPRTPAFVQEVCMGWRLPHENEVDESLESFHKKIKSDRTINDTGEAQYKSANTEILSLIISKVSGRSLFDHLIEIVEAAGLEGVLHVGTDRTGRPCLNGGACMTARDLARYGSLFTRRGQGVAQRSIGCETFIEATLSHGVAMPSPRSWLRYSNHMQTNGQWLGHEGYGGQFMLAKPSNGVTAVFLSVLEDRDGFDVNYNARIIEMLNQVSSRYPNS